MDGLVCAFRGRRFFFARRFSWIFRLVSRASSRLDSPPLIAIYLAVSVWSDRQ